MATKKITKDFDAAKMFAISKVLFNKQPSDLKIPAKTKTLGDFFLDGRVTLYMLQVGDDKYLVELAEVPTSWPRHHGYQPKKKVALGSTI